MGFGNFLRGIGAAIIPGGKSYGDYNPPSKKKKQDDQANFGSGLPAAPRPTQSNPLSVQRPQNHFDAGITHFNLPVAPTNNVAVKPNINLAPLVKPQPGTVITPTAQPKSGYEVPQGLSGTRALKNGENGTMVNNHFVPDAPKKQDNRFWQKVGRGVKTVGQTAVGTVANIPEVGLAAARAGTGIIQGVTQLPHIVTAANATATQKLNEAAPNRFTHALNTGAQAVNHGVKVATDVVDKPFGVVNRGLDRAAQGYENRAPGAAGGAEAYRATQVPLNVLAGLLTMGGSTAAGEAGQAGRAGESGGIISKITQVLNKPRVANTDNIVSKTAQVVSNKTTPVVQAVNNPISAVRAGVNNVRSLPIFNRSVSVPALEAAGVDAGEVGNIASDATHIPVTQSSSVDVVAPPTEPVNIPVRNTTPQGQPIVEIGGDSPGQVRIPTQDEVAAQRAANRFDSQAPARPDQRIEGVSKPNTGNTGVFTRAEIQAERQALDESLAKGEINKTAHKAANKELDSLTAADDAPKGKKIQVKQVDPITVQNHTDVPTDLPEVPGQVRVTDSAAPNNAASAEVAAKAPTPILPPETQAVLDNPKQFNKRQVAAARNQAKMAKAKAKADEQTAAALERINSASPNPSSDEGFVATGKFDKSSNGGNYQVASRKAEMDQAIHETTQMSPVDAIKTARENQATNGGFNPRDIRNIRAMFETKRIQRGTPEWQEARQILKDDGTLTAQALALRGGTTIRRTASPTELVSQYESKIYRLADDPTKIDSKMFDDVEAATTKFTDARDAAVQAHNRFTEAPTSANAKAYHAAQDAADAADKESKMVEFKIAQKILKGNKDTKQVRELQKMAQESDMYQMDSVDASMLSGTGTFARNFVNSVVGGSEEGLFGGVASRIAKAITGEKVGGGFGKGTISGFKKGAHNVVDASKARAGQAGWNPLEHIKNWSTTGNQLGDTVIESQVTHNVIDHYTQVLKGEGYKGRELTDRASVMARQDPDNVGRVYAGYARAAAGLGSGIAKGGKIETIVKNAISDALSLGNPNQASEIAAKLITRMTVGFPSAVGRTIVEGGKRATLGVPNALKLFGRDARNDPAVRAQIIKDSIKQAGSGATAGAIFYSLGQQGLVTGSYPTDPEERARWQREGITENSIKIGDNYYQLPSYLGSAAIPAMFAATLGRNDGDVAKSAAEVVKGLPAILPTDQASNWLDALNGRTDPAKFATQTAASATRALTPAGALLNQIAKSFDSTANDTTTGTALENFVDKVASGIPGVNNAANIPDKTDDAGNVIHNPGALPLALGASSTTQGKGEERSAEIATKVDGKVKSLSDAGALSDPNLKGILDDKTLKIYNDVNSGKKVSDGDVKKLQDALVKGVSSTGDDTAYLEREQYDTNLAALKIKRELMSEDKTVKPSDIKKVDVAIQRGQVYKDNTIPYDLIQSYESTSLTDWRAMGDPENDSYDPEMYQKLWDIDNVMTGAGVSYKKGDLTSNKFSAKKAGNGRGGGSGSRSYSSDFGQLKAGTGAPSVQQYQSLDKASGSIPLIQVQRPNIVHKIGSSG